MAGKKGMKHFGAAIIEEVLQMKREGKTNREIAEHFGLEENTFLKSHRKLVLGNIMKL